MKWWKGEEMIGDMQIDNECKNCKKDWTKCSTCPQMMKWVKEQKEKNKNGGIRKRYEND